MGICPTHDDYFLGYLQERFGTPYLLDVMPIGIQHTSDWLLQIASFFGLQAIADRIIEREIADLTGPGSIPPGVAGEKGLSERRGDQGGGDGIVDAGARLPGAGYQGHHYDHFGDGMYQQLLASEPDLEVNIATTQVFELVNMLVRVRPDLFLGHSGSNIWAAKLGIPTLPIFNQNNYYLGYRGAFDLARRAVKLLANNAFQDQLRDHLKLPFKEDWYAKNPFTYIT